MLHIAFRNFCIALSSLLIGNGLFSNAALGSQRQIYSKPSLIRLQLIHMSDNPDRNVKNAVHSLVHTLKRHAALRKADESFVCSDKTDTVSSHLHYYVETSTASETSVDE
jgi:hypothetical protein